MTTWTRVARVADIEPGDYASAEIDDVFVAVYNIDGEFFAIDDLCTHDGGGLAGGEIEDHQVICPRHGSRFCLRTGKALTPPPTSRCAATRPGSRTTVTWKSAANETHHPGTSREGRLVDAGPAGLGPGSQRSAASEMHRKWRDACARSS